MPGKAMEPEARRMGNLGKLDSVGWNEFRRLAPLEQERLLIGARLEKILPNTYHLPDVGWSSGRISDKARAGLDSKMLEVNWQSCDSNLKERVFRDQRDKEREMDEIKKEIGRVAGTIAPQEAQIPPKTMLRTLCRISKLVEEKNILEEQVWILGNAWKNLNGQNRRTTPSGY